MNDSNELVNDLLAQWHRWARGYQHAAGIGSQPMFREAKSSRGWDSLADIVDDTLDHSRMEAIDHIIMSMDGLFRTALQIHARNLVTGRSVWTSARLPVDVQDRDRVLGNAKCELVRKLGEAGIL